jgi:hypothetical protein
MADFGSAGVWDHNGAPVDPDCLSLSIQVRTDLDRWSGRFQRLYKDEADLDSFSSDGLAIAHAVKVELPTWSIIYYDEAAAARANYSGARAEYEVHIQGPCTSSGSANLDREHEASLRGSRPALRDRVSAVGGFAPGLAQDESAPAMPH